MELLDLPTEVVHRIAFHQTLSPSDVVSFALASRASYRLLFGDLGVENAFDVDQHRALCGAVTCVKRGWWRAATLAVSRGFGNPAGEWRATIGSLVNPLILAAGAGQTKLVSVLLAHPDVVPYANLNAALRVSARNGHADIVKLLLDSDPRVDPSCGNQYPIRHALHNNHLPVVDLLLADPRVIHPDPQSHS